MNEEIIHRLFQVFLYTGGFVSFWQITKHIPKAFHNFIEYILGGNIDITMMFIGCICGVALLCVLWMVLVSLSRAWQGKEQFKYVIL